MKTIEGFIKNLNKDDIDLSNKLNNLLDGNQICKEVYELMQDEDNFDSVEEYIKEILCDDIGISPFTKGCINFIVQETEFLYMDGLIDKEDDFTGGLYNCDELYLYAISDVLEMETLDYYMPMKLEDIAYNAISFMLNESKMSIAQVCKYIGCTKTDLERYELVKGE